jgi:tRNA(Ile)-lysidine synthase
VAHVDVPRTSSEGLEAAARNLRYQVFARLDVQYVLLAHHANDQAETLLLNLMRGAGVLGAAGMPMASDDGRYLRPLLPHTRGKLESYARDHTLRWCEDDSNIDTTRARNFMRHEVVPLLSSRYPTAIQNLARSVEHFAEAQTMLDEIARLDLGELEDFPVPLDLLRALPTARARNLVRYLLLKHKLQAPSHKRLSEALRQFIDATPDKHPCLELPAYRLYRTKGAVCLSRDAQ